MTNESSQLGLVGDRTIQNKLPSRLPRQRNAPPNMGRTMWQRVFRFLSLAIGILLPLVVPAICAGWLLLRPMIAAHENRSIRNTGLPESHRSLFWSDWKNGADGLRPTTILEGLNPSAEIVAHRVGIARGFATQLTFYQARYRLPDSSIRVAHADGPLPLISFRWGALSATFVASLLAAAALIRCTGRRGVSPEQSCGVVARMQHDE